MGLHPYRRTIRSVGFALSMLGLIALLAASFGALPAPVRHTPGKALHSLGILARVPTRGGALGTGAHASFTTWLIFTALVIVLVGISHATWLADRSTGSDALPRPAEAPAEWPPSYYYAEDWEDGPYRDGRGVGGRE
jgi:hypothetical protein